MQRSVNIEVELRRPTDNDRPKIEKILKSGSTADFLSCTFDVNDMTESIIKYGTSSDSNGTNFIYPLLIQAGISTTSRLSGKTEVESVLVGVIILSSSRDYMNTLNIFYAIDSNYRNLGICSKAMSKLMENIPTGNVPISRLQLIIADGNIASMKVAEHIGFELEGVAKKCMVVGEDTVDCYIYSYTYEQPLEAGRAEKMFLEEPEKEPQNTPEPVEEPEEKQPVQEESDKSSPSSEEVRPHLNILSFDEEDEPIDMVNVKEDKTEISSDKISPDKISPDKISPDKIDMALQMYDEMNTDIRQDISVSKKNKDELTNRNSINQSFGKMLSDMLGSIDDVDFVDEPDEYPNEDEGDDSHFILDDESDAEFTEDDEETGEDVESDVDPDEDVDSDEDDVEPNEDDSDEDDGSDYNPIETDDVLNEIEEISPEHEYENAESEDNVSISCSQKVDNSQISPRITVGRLNLKGLTKNKLNRKG